MLEMELKWEEGYDWLLSKPEMVLKRERDYSIYTFLMAVKNACGSETISFPFFLVAME